MQSFRRTFLLCLALIDIFDRKRCLGRQFAVVELKASMVLCRKGMLIDDSTCTSSTLGVARGASASLCVRTARWTNDKDRGAQGVSTKAQSGGRARQSRPDGYQTYRVGAILWSIL